VFHEIVGNYTGNKCTILDEEVESVPDLISFSSASFQSWKITKQCTAVDMNWNFKNSTVGLFYDTKKKAELGKGTNRTDVRKK